MQKFFYPAAVLVVAAVFVPPAIAQTAATPPKTPAPQTAPPTQPPPTQAPPTQAPPRPATPRPRAATPSATQVIVRNNSGTGLEGVRIGVSGASGQQTMTDAKGAASVTLPAGNYRLRFEHEEFITLERDVTIRAGQNAEIVVALDVAPPPPEPPAPAPPPPPEPAPKVVASGPPSNVSIPQFLEKNYIGRDPLKESVLGCTAAATTRVLQLRDSLASHTHADLDETLYVVAGEGTVRVGNQTMMIAPGSLAVIPRGLAHATERSGRNPLILLSTLSGAPCASTPNGP